MSYVFRSFVVFFQAALLCSIVSLLLDMCFFYVVVITALNLLFLTADFAILSELRVRLEYTKFFFNLISIFFPSDGCWHQKIFFSNFLCLGQHTSWRCKSYLEKLCHVTKTKLNCFSHSELLGQERICFWRFITIATTKRKQSNPLQLIPKNTFTGSKKQSGAGKDVWENGRKLTQWRWIMVLLSDWLVHATLIIFWSNVLTEHYLFCIREA